MGVELSKIVEEVNRLSVSDEFQVGKLQQLRVEIRGVLRNQSGLRLIMPQRNDPTYAFHWGGRKEFQFNLGIENSRIRYGVAFSLEPGRNFPVNEIRALLPPKIERFNDFMRWKPNAYSTMAMWDWTSKQRSTERHPGPIDENLQKEASFIFLGKSVTQENWNPKVALNTFDELLPLYEYVERDQECFLKPIYKEENRFFFRPGCPPKSNSTMGERSPDVFSIRLRHNKMQQELYDKMALKYGAENVGTEIPSGNGVRIDLVVRNNEDSYIFYEIKTSHEPRFCIREAIGQLLEYGFWSDDGQEPTSLVIVGPRPVDEQGKKYLRFLREKFSLPVTYENL